MGETTATLVTAAVLVIGDEILSGRTKDRNIGHIADVLTAVGIQLREARIIPDDTAEIMSAVNALRARYDYVFTSGGIGPTHDDITSDAIATAFGVALPEDPRALAMLRERYDEAELTPARRRMARIPAGAELIKNPVSKAPGFMIGNVIVLAGVPAVMHCMLDDIMPRLRTGAKMLSVTVRVTVGEGLVAGLLEDTQKAFPDVAMGSYPFFEKGLVGTQLVLRSTDADKLAEAEANLRARLIATDVPHV